MGLATQKKPAVKSNRHLSGINPAYHLSEFLWPGDFSIRLRLERLRLFSRSNDFPIIVTGPKGVGKSHLLNGLMMDALESKPHLSTFFLNAKTGILADFSEAFIRYLEQCDMLCIDNICSIDDVPLLKSILRVRGQNLRQTIISEADLKNIMELGFGNIVDSGHIISLRCPDKLQIERLIRRESELSVSKKKIQKLLRYRYQNIPDVMLTLCSAARSLERSSACMRNHAS